MAIQLYPPLFSRYFLTMLPPLPPHLSLAQLPTPLQLMPRLSRELGGPRIWIKRDDLTGTALTGNKIRKLEYLLADAQQQDANVLITCGGVQSNHCRATAILAAQLGLKAHLILRGATPPVADANLLLDQLCGASVAFYTAREYQARLPELFAHWREVLTAQGMKPYAIPTGGSNTMGLWGYVQAAQELHEQLQTLNLNPQVIVCATGSGGTQAGLTLGMGHLRPQVEVVGMAVCDSAEYFNSKVQNDIDLWANQYSPLETPRVTVRTNDSYIGPGYALATEDVFNTIRWAGRTEGLILDPVYTGKAFHGLVQEIRQGRYKHMDDVVFVHTGGIFGLFPYRSELGQASAVDQL